MFKIRRRFISITILLLIPITAIMLFHSKPASDWFDSQTGVYRFPYDRNSPEWLNAASAAERQQLFVIPEDLLHDIPTDQLLELVLAYPYNANLYYFDTPLQGLIQVKGIFNGLSELLDRADAGKYITEKFLEIPLPEENYTAGDDMIILMLSLQFIQAQLTESEYMNFINKADELSQDQNSDFKTTLRVLNNTLHRQ
ncbi:hypothetical protein [Anaerolentibacter hominis]|uniref:hypothetical protein n=1 Tax=Anaerolentibacter hominis TaxID=3079009 RepID=UPI0031B80F2A